MDIGSEDKATGGTSVDIKFCASDGDRKIATQNYNYL